MFTEFFIGEADQAALELHMPHVPRKGELVLLEREKELSQYLVVDVQWVVSADPEHEPFAQVFLDTMEEDEGQ